MTARRFRYDDRSLRGDLLRAGLGLLLTLGPMLLVQVAWWIGLILGAAATVFLAFGLRTMLRRATTVEMDEGGVRALGPFGGGVRWDDLEAVRLDYYATKRDRRDGWMLLRLRGGGRLTVESSLDGFDLVAERVAEAARSRRVPMTETTLRNFLALGIDADPDTRR